MILGLADDPNIQWVKKGDLVIFRAEFKFDRPAPRTKFWMPKAPAARFQKQDKAIIGLPANEDLYAIVLDKYRVSEKWGNDRHRLVWVYHLFVHESVIYFDPGGKGSNEPHYFLRKAENAEDDRQDLSNDQGHLDHKGSNP